MVFSEAEGMRERGKPCQRHARHARAGQSPFSGNTRYSRPVHFMPTEKQRKRKRPRFQYPSRTHPIGLTFFLLEPTS